MAQEKPEHDNYVMEQGQINMTAEISVNFRTENGDTGNLSRED